MRITVTLDPDVDLMVRERMASSGATFKAVVNEVMRGGIAASMPAPGTTAHHQAQRHQAETNQPQKNQAELNQAELNQA